MPPEMYDLILCRDVFHCTPTQLDEIPTEEMMHYMAVLSGEAYVAKQERDRG